MRETVAPVQKQVGDIEQRTSATVTGLEGPRRPHGFAVSGLLPGWEYASGFDAATGLFTVTSLNTAVAVPEPGTWALMLGGVAALLGARRLRRGAGERA